MAQLSQLILLTSYDVYYINNDTPKIFSSLTECFEKCGKRNFDSFAYQEQTVSRVYRENVSQHAITVLVIKSLDRN